jgi:hypothetical protein
MVGNGYRRCPQVFQATVFDSPNVHQRAGGTVLNSVLNPSRDIATGRVGAAHYRLEHPV